MKEELYDLVEIRVKFPDFQSGFRSWGCSWKPALVHSSEKLFISVRNDNSVKLLVVLTFFLLFIWTFTRTKIHHSRRLKILQKLGVQQCGISAQTGSFDFSHHFPDKEQLQQEHSLQQLHFYLVCKLGSERLFICPLKLRDTAWIPGYNHGYLRPDVQFRCTKLLYKFFPFQMKNKGLVGDDNRRDSMWDLLLGCAMACTCWK